MKIAVPISSVEEIKPLAAAGADEFYFGVLTQEWEYKFGSALANRRDLGNLYGFDSLRSTVETVKELDKKSLLAINAQQYTPGQTLCIFDVVERFVEFGGDGVILGEPWLVKALARKHPGLKLHVSSIAACRSSETALFYKELGASRVVLPRYAALDEVKGMISNVPSLEFEVFILNDGCLYEEGVCHTLHLPNHLGGPICMDNYDYRYSRVEGKNLEREETETLNRNDEDYRLWAWYKFSCGFTLTEKGYPYGPCGLCAIPFFAACDLTAVKIAGRDTPTARKLKSLEMVKAVYDRVTDGASEAEVVAFAQGLRNKKEYCMSRYMCYFPDVLDRHRRGGTANRTPAPRSG
jgi:collagenase-like PrtC family protease